MAQYRDYSVSVTINSNVVTGAAGTKFLTNAAPGNGFKIKNDPVVYTIASVISDVELRLSAPYQGATAANQQYQITRDYTPNFGLGEVYTGDQDWPSHLTQTIRKMDSLIGDGDNMVLTDTVTGSKYFLRVTNGILSVVAV